MFTDSDDLRTAKLKLRSEELVLRREEAASAALRQAEELALRREENAIARINAENAANTTRMMMEMLSKFITPKQ
jgi:hypothetical protein